jgi:AraC-like DNA-binding protein
MRPGSVWIIYAEQGYFRLAVNGEKQMLVARSQFACFATEEAHLLSILIDPVKQEKCAILVIEINVDEQVEHSFYLERLKDIVKRMISSPFLTSVALQTAFIFITKHIDQPNPLYTDGKIGLILNAILSKTENQVDLTHQVADVPGEEDLAFLIAEMIIIEMDEDWSIEKLATHYQLNTKKLKAIFKRHVGMPAAAFKIFIRMQKARQLLEETDISVQDISLQIGYPDPAHFSKLFKQKMGISPSSIRKNMKLQHKRRQG